MIQKKYIGRQTRIFFVRIKWLELINAKNSRYLEMNIKVNKILISKRLNNYICQFKTNVLNWHIKILIGKTLYRAVKRRDPVKYSYGTVTRWSPKITMIIENQTKKLISGVLKILWSITICIIRYKKKYYSILKNSGCNSISNNYKVDLMIDNSIFKYPRL